MSVTRQYWRCMRCRISHRTGRQCPAAQQRHAEDTVRLWWLQAANPKVDAVPRGGFVLTYLRDMRVTHVSGTTMREAIDRVLRGQK